MAPLLSVSRELFPTTIGVERPLRHGTVSLPLLYFVMQLFVHGLRVIACLFVPLFYLGRPSAPGR